MWRFKEINYKTLLYFPLVFLMLLLVLSCSRYSDEQQKIFKAVETIDFNKVETPVSEKISGLLDATKKEPGLARNWGNLGMNLFIHGFKKESPAVFKKAAALDENEFRWSYFCALVLNDLNDEETIAWFEKSRRLKPGYPPLCVTLANRYLLSGDMREADELFKEALASYKNVPHAWVGLAKIAIAQNELDSADSYLNKAMHFAPYYRETHVLLADLYRRKGDTVRAESEIEMISKLSDRLDLKDPVYNEMVDEGVSSFWHQVRGDNYLKSGQLENAAIEFKKVLELKPHASFNVNLGNVYQQQKKYDLASEQYRLALTRDTVNFDALNNLGVLYFKKGDLDSAVFLVKEALRLNPDLTDAYLNLGTFYKEMNHDAQAVRCFKQGIELAENDLRFAYQLSWLFSSSPQKEIRDGKEALRLAKLIFEYKAMDMPSKYDLVAAALAENGQYEKADEMATSAYQQAMQTGKHKQAAAIAKRVKLYKMNKPYREADHKTF